MSYDPAGRLYEEDATATTRFLYAGDQAIAEMNTSSSTLRRYVRGGGVDEALVWYEGSGTSDRRFLLSDIRGSVVAVTDGAGAATNINTYDEYGVPGSNNAGRFQYTGQMWLAAQGLYHYKARAYNPASGRFMQPDPIGYGDGMNIYAYAGNDPINNTDPTGLSCWASRLATCNQQDAIGGGGDDVEGAEDSGDGGGEGVASPQPGQGGGASSSEIGAGIRDRVVVTGTKGGGASFSGQLGFATRQNSYSSKSQRSYCYGDSGGTIGGGCTVTAARPAFSPVSNWYYQMYGGFPPGDYCYQNPACSGRANAINLEFYAAGGAAGKALSLISGRYAANAVLNGILKNPNLVRNFSPEQVRFFGRLAGWRVTTVGRGQSAGLGVRLLNQSKRIQYSPGVSRRYGGPYWTVSSPQGGKTRILLGGG